MSLSPDGRLLSTAGDDHVVRLWNPESGELSYPRLTHTNGVSSARFTPDGSQLVTGCFDRTVRTWSLTTRPNHEVHLNLDKSATVVGNITANSELLIATTDGAALLCHIDESGPKLRPLPDRRTASVAALAKRGDLLATASKERQVCVWSLADNRLHAKTPPVAGRIKGLSFSPDSKRLLISCDDGTVSIWTDGSGLKMSVVSHGGRLACSGFSSARQVIYTAGEDSIVKIWDAQSGRLLSRTDTSANRNATYIFAPFADRLAKIGPLNSLQVWDLSSGNVVGASGRLAAVTNAAFSSDGRRLVTGGHSNSAQVWDSVDGRAISGRLVHLRDVLCCAFSNDCALVASASDDGTVRIWDANTGEPVSPYLHHSDRVVFVGFTADDSALVSLDAGGTLRTWPLVGPTLDTEQLVRLAHIYSGQEIDANGSIVSINPEVLAHDWADCRVNSRTAGKPPFARAAQSTNPNDE
jgi:WD40 repeat protein